MKSVILPISPIYANAIIDGKDRIVFRKKIFKEDVDKIFIYVPKPERTIIGYFTIDLITEHPPEIIWGNCGHIAGVEKDDFFDYFKDSRSGFVIYIDEVVKFKEELFPEEFIPNFKTPKAFCYISDDIANKLINNGLK